ncbi:TPA: hypothetical protein ACNBW6_003883 [Escherichia coli]
MENFENILKMAIETYSELSGISKEEIIKECQDFESQTSKNVQLLMFSIA